MRLKSLAIRILHNLHLKYIKYSRKKSTRSPKEIQKKIQVIHSRRSKSIFHSIPETDKKIVWNISSEIEENI